MTHYVGPRAAISAPAGKHLCSRCEGRGSLRYGPGGRIIPRTSYAETAFWRLCSLCRGTGRLQRQVALQHAA